MFNIKTCSVQNLTGLSISLWELKILRRCTLVHGFCFYFKFLLQVVRVKFHWSVSYAAIDDEHLQVR